MRLLKLNSPLLALIVSVLVEALFVVCFWLFGTITQFGTLTNFWSRAFIGFHFPSVIVTDHCVTMANGSLWQDIVGYLIFFTIALLEWWLVIFAAIWCFRHFTKRTA
jgi:hypothetical protein